MPAACVSGAVNNQQMRKFYETKGCTCNAEKEYDCAAGGLCSHKLKSLTFELVAVCTYDAAMVSIASGSVGGQYFSGCFTTLLATFTTTTSGPGVSLLAEHEHIGCQLTVGELNCLSGRHSLHLTTTTNCLGG